MQTDLTVTNPGAVTRMPSVDIGALLQQAIATPGAVDAIERIVALRDKMNADAAKAAFDEAMTAFQSECHPIHKDKLVNDAGGRKLYSFAPIEAIEIQIRPLLRKHGFSHTFDVDTKSPDGWVFSQCIVTHTLGHSRTATGKFPLGAGTRAMSTTQIYAATESFAKRRALMNAYGIVVIGEDIDGTTGRPPGRGPSKVAAPSEDLKPLAVELWKLTAPFIPAEKREIKDWNARNQWLWERDILDGGIPEEAPNLSADKFREVIAEVKKRKTNQ